MLERCPNRLSSEVYLIPKVKAELVVRPGHTGKSWAWLLLSRSSSLIMKKSLQDGAMWAVRGLEVGAANQPGRGATRESLRLLER